MKSLNKIGICVIILMLLATTFLFAQIQFDTGNININGFMSQGYMYSTDNNFMGQTSKGTFEFNELGLNFSSEVADNLRIGMQLFTRDLGNLDNNKIIVDWAYGDYRLYDWLGFRAGKMKMPVGMYNEIRDVDMLRTNIIMPLGVYNESWRSTFNAIKGFGIYGSVIAGALGTFNYQGQTGVLNITGDSGLNKYIEDQLESNFDSYSLSSTNVINLNWETPLPNLKLGGSYFAMSELSISGNTVNNSFWRNNTVGAANELAAGLGLPAGPSTYEEALGFFQMTGIDLNMVNRPIVQTIENINAYWLSGEFAWNELTIAGEYFKMASDLGTVSPGFGAAIDPNMENLPGPADNELGGFYGMIDYQLTDDLAASVYYTEYDPDLNDNNESTKDKAFSIKYNVNAFWTIKAEAHLIEGQDFLFRADQEDPSDIAEDWNLFTAKLTYNF
jgi:hypothetical protein